MAELVKTIEGFLPKIQDVSAGMAGIFAALVALALLGILFSRIGK